MVSHGAGEDGSTHGSRPRLWNLRSLFREHNLEPRVCDWKAYKRGLKKEASGHVTRPLDILLKDFGLIFRQWRAMKCS